MDMFDSEELLKRMKKIRKFIEMDDSSALRSIDISGVDLNNFRCAHHDSLLHLSVRRKSLAAASFLLENGIDVNGVNKHGDTPLIVACKSDYADMIGLLISHGADINHYTRTGLLAIHIAAKFGCCDNIDELIRLGNNPSALSRSGNTTPIVMAILAERETAVMRLLAGGADLSVVDQKGLTPFQYCDKTKNPRMYSIVEKHLLSGRVREAKVAEPVCCGL